MDSGSEIAGFDASVSHSVLQVFLSPVHLGDNILGFLPREVYETTTPTPRLASSGISFLQPRKVFCCSSQQSAKGEAGEQGFCLPSPQMSEPSSS